METSWLGANVPGVEAFKSYYVVWKLKFSQKGHGEGHGLNRTM